MLLSIATGGVISRPQRSSSCGVHDPGARSGWVFSQTLFRSTEKPGARPVATKAGRSEYKIGSTGRLPPDLERSVARRQPEAGSDPAEMEPRTGASCTVLTETV